MFVVAVLTVTEENSRIRIRYKLEVRISDPDLYEMSQIRNTASDYLKLKLG